MDDRVIALEKDLEIISQKVLQLAWKVDDIEKMESDDPTEDIERLSKIIYSDVYNLKGKMASLENDLSEVRARIGWINEFISSYEPPVIQIPDTNIVSHNLWKRMWAVFGHGLLGNVILILWIIAIIIMLFSGS